MSNIIKHHFYINSQKDNISDKAVSVHSIVTDNEEDLNSGNEAPEDLHYQEVKIIKNYVIKRILKPGKGLEKPSKTDFVESKFF